MPLTFTWDLPHDSTAPGQGRWHMREMLANNTEAIDAELVVTELITNAWKHGTGTGVITLRADLFDDHLRIEVCGEASDDPTVRTDPEESGGRGLLLIEGLATGWGFHRDGDLLCVWAEIELP